MTGPVSFADVDVPPFETAVTFDADDPQKEYPGFPLGSVSGLVKVLIANLDGDSFGDIVTANQETRNISVMINATTSCP